MSDITFHYILPYSDDTQRTEWEASVTVDDNEYTVYLQLPHCIESRHRVIDGAALGIIDDPDEAVYWLLEEIAEAAEAKLESEGRL